MLRARSSPARNVQSGRPNRSCAIRARPVTASVPATAEPIRHPKDPSRKPRSRARSSTCRGAGGRTSRRPIPVRGTRARWVTRPADLVGAADEDARRLRVVVLVEDQRRRARQSHPDHGGDGRDGEIATHGRFRRRRNDASTRSATRGSVSRAPRRRSSARPVLEAIDELQPLEGLVIEALLLSTSPASSPIRWTVSKPRSVGSVAAFFGHATQSRPAGSRPAASAANRDRGPAPRSRTRGRRPSGSRAVGAAGRRSAGSRGRCRSSGAAATYTFAPSRMPSFFGSGVPE